MKGNEIMTALSRRSLLAGVAYAGGAAAVSLPAAELHAGTAHQAQAPGLYRLRVGAAVVTVLLDGYLDIAPEWWVHTTPEALGTALEESFRPVDEPLRISVNAYIIQLGGRTIAVDAGADTLFGPTAGRYGQALQAAGIDPASVDTVLMSHLHPDHVGGLIAGGRAAFANAAVKVAAPELAYWTDAGHRAAAPDFARPWFDAVAETMRLYGDRVTTFRGEAAVAPGITAIPLPGHTPGHTGFVLESGGERLFLWGDVTDFLALQLADPAATLVFDIDKAEGERSRRRAIEVAASERLMIGGAHVPFPSVGHIAGPAAQRRFLPATWQHVL
ncbi:MAG: MBL fold metallo-hydrolase [Pseudomonadota bacterium]